MTIYIAAVAVVGGSFLLTYVPLQKKLNAVRADLKQQNLAIEKASEQSMLMPALKEKKQNILNIVKNYDLNIPAQRNLGQYLQVIADLMNEHQLKDNIVQPEAEIKTEQLQCIPISMKCKGTLSQLFEFYKSFQQLDRLIHIEEIELVNDDSFNGEITMNTKAIIYYKPQDRQG